MIVHNVYIHKLFVLDKSIIKAMLTWLIIHQQINKIEYKPNYEERNIFRELISELEWKRELFVILFKISHIFINKKLCYFSF